MFIQCGRETNIVSFFLMQLIKIFRDHVSTGVVPGSGADAIPCIDGVRTRSAQISTPGFIAGTGN